MAHAGGRPKKYNSVEEMIIVIDEYFDSCFTPVIHEGKVVLDNEGQTIYKQTKPFTICGLSNALDMSRQSLLNYEKNNEYFDTITRAKRLCEQYAEERLFDKDGVVGAKFSLINNYANWKEKNETELNDKRKIEIHNDLGSE